MHRRAILQAAAIGIIFYSILVLIVANLSADVGFQALGGEEIRFAWIRQKSILQQDSQAPRVGDRIVSIAGTPIVSLPQFINSLSHIRDRSKVAAVARESLAESNESVVQLPNERLAVAVVFESNARGGQHTAWFEVTDQHWQKSAISVAWFAAESLVFWLGWLVYRRRPEDDAAALFFLSCILTVGAYMGGYHWLQIAGQPALLLVFALCAMALPQVNLHYFLLFPSPKTFITRYPKLVWALLYLIPGVLQIIVLWCIGDVISSYRQQLEPARIHATLGRLEFWAKDVYLTLGGFMFIGCVISLVHSHRTVTSRRSREQIRWILGGVAVASIFVAYAIGQAIRNPIEFALGGPSLGGELTIGAGVWAMFAASLAFTVAHAIGIARYRLIHVEKLLRRGVLYLSVHFATGLLYWVMVLLAVWYSRYVVPDADQSQSIPIAAFAVGSLLALSAIRTRVQRILDRRFYREKLEIGRRAERPAGPSPSLPVLRRTAMVVREVLDATNVALYLQEPRGFVLVELLGNNRYPSFFPLEDPLVGLLTNGQLVQRQPGPLLSGDVSTSLLRKLDAEIAQPLMVENALVGFLIIDVRAEGSYGSEELAFLSGLADLAAIAIHHAQNEKSLMDTRRYLLHKLDLLKQASQQRLAHRGSPQTASVPRLAEPDDLGTSTPEAGTGNPHPDQTEAGHPIRLTGCWGESEAIRRVLAVANKVATSDATILIRGESGTGKTLLAEAIHLASTRARGPFVKVHCAALSSGVLESELFGHVKGAFTGAHRDKVGRFQFADGGTIFLDEIGDISLEIQTKLLRVLQEKTFEPVGSSESVQVDVRVIAATHRPLVEWIERGRLREDLYYRLNVINLEMPPLRDRRQDIVPLAYHFLRKFAARSHKEIAELDPDVIERLVAYDWPGNIRELENIIERAVVMAEGWAIELEDLPEELGIAPLLSSPEPRRRPDPFLWKLAVLRRPAVGLGKLGSASGGDPTTMEKSISWNKNVYARHFGWQVGTKVRPPSPWGYLGVLFVAN